MRTLEGEAVGIPVGPRIELSADRRADRRGVDAAHARRADRVAVESDGHDGRRTTKWRGSPPRVDARGGALIVDEIYLGLVVYGVVPRSALESRRIGLFVINSFSKYFNMTGWRLGWLVAPEAHVRDLEKLAQNLYISPPTLSQHAALACFEPATLALLEARRAEFQARRDFLVPALRELGFRHSGDADRWLFRLRRLLALRHGQRTLLRARRWPPPASRSRPASISAAIAPGDHVRFAYTIAQDKLREGVRRLAAWLPRLQRIAKRRWRRRSSVGRR